MATSMRSASGFSRARSSRETSLGAAAPGTSTAPMTTSAVVIWVSMVAGSDCSTRALLPNMSSSSRTRRGETSRMVTSARMPTARVAAWVPTTPPPRMTTFAGATPGEPPSSRPGPPCGCIRYWPAACAARRPAISLIGVSSGSAPCDVLDGLVGDRGDLRLDEGVGERPVGGQVQVGEQRGGLPQVAVLGGDGLLDLDDEVGPPRVGGVHQLGSGTFVGEVVDAGGRPRRRTRRAPRVRRR